MDAGFIPEAWEDVTGMARDMLAKQLKALEKGGEAPAGANLLMRSAPASVMKNLVRNLEEGRMVTAMGTWTKPRLDRY